LNLETIGRIKGSYRASARIASVSCSSLLGGRPSIARWNPNQGTIELMMAIDDLEGERRQPGILLQTYAILFYEYTHPKIDLA
jgi:hypothetical protein